MFLLLLVPNRPHPLTSTFSSRPQQYKIRPSTRPFQHLASSLSLKYFDRISYCALHSRNRYHWLYRASSAEKLQQRLRTAAAHRSSPTEADSLSRFAFNTCYSNDEGKSSLTATYTARTAQFNSRSSLWLMLAWKVSGKQCGKCIDLGMR